MEVHHQEGLSPSISSPRQVSYSRMALNVVGCAVSLPIFWLATVHCRWPVTLDLLFTIALAELTRYVNEGRRMAYHEDGCISPVVKEKMDPEKAGFDVESISSSVTTRLDTMAAIVGWREEPALYTRALESYRRARGCVFLIAGVDGDEKQDEDMVDVFNLVSILTFENDSGLTFGTGVSRWLSNDSRLRASRRGSSKRPHQGDRHPSKPRSQDRRQRDRPSRYVSLRSSRSLSTHQGKHHLQRS